MFIEIGPSLAGLLLPVTFGIAIGIAFYTGSFVVKALMYGMGKM